MIPYFGNKCKHNEQKTPAANVCQNPQTVKKLSITLSSRTSPQAGVAIPSNRRRLSQFFGNKNSRMPKHPGAIFLCYLIGYREETFLM